MKIALTEELEYVKAKLLGTVTGSPGQQLMVNKFLSRKIGDQKVPNCRSGRLVEGARRCTGASLHRSTRAPFPTTRGLGAGRAGDLARRSKARSASGASLSSPVRRRRIEAVAILSLPVVSRFPVQGPMPTFSKVCRSRASSRSSSRTESVDKHVHSGRRAVLGPRQTGPSAPCTSFRHWGASDTDHHMR